LRMRVAVSHQVESGEEHLPAPLLIQEGLSVAKGGGYSGDVRRRGPAHPPPIFPNPQPVGNRIRRPYFMRIR
jgi:hypothetical protein